MRLGSTEANSEKLLGGHGLLRLQHAREHPAAVPLLLPSAAAPVERGAAAVFGGARRRGRRSRAVHVHGGDEEFVLGPGNLGQVVGMLAEGHLPTSDLARRW